MTIYESDLPGVGKKFEVELDDERRLVIITHNTGKREVFLKPSTDADSEKLFELSDQLARTVGTILEGAYFQPVRTDRVETMLSDETFLEWYGVVEGSELVGETLESADVGRRIGVSIVAIQRGDEVVAAPGADTEIRADDTLVVIGSREDLKRFESLLASRSTGVSEDGDVREDGAGTGGANSEDSDAVEE